jgi:hypothetical protein
MLTCCCASCVAMTAIFPEGVRHFVFEARGFEFDVRHARFDFFQVTLDALSDHREMEPGRRQQGRRQCVQGERQLANGGGGVTGAVGDHRRGGDEAVAQGVDSF